MKPETELGRQEWVAALNAALLLIHEQKDDKERLPAEWELLYLETWDGVKANLMAMCHTLWEQTQGQNG